MEETGQRSDQIDRRRLIRSDPPPPHQIRSAAAAYRSDQICRHLMRSSTAVLPNGTVLQTGGYNDGDRTARLYKPYTVADASYDWQEINPALALRCWYATNHILPEGQLIIVGGRRQFSCEFYPRRSEAERPRNLPFLHLKEP